MISTVLVVEDEDDVRTMLATALLDEGFEVQTAENGEHALSQCERREPDVIVLDLLMPVMGGRAFVEAYRRRRSATARIVVVSGAAGAERTAHEMACEAGFAKPVAIDELLRAVTTLAELRP